MTSGRGGGNTVRAGGGPKSPEAGLFRHAFCSLGALFAVSGPQTRREPHIGPIGGVWPGRRPSRRPHHARHEPDIAFTAGRPHDEQIPMTSPDPHDEPESP